MRLASSFLIAVTCCFACSNDQVSETSPMDRMELKGVLPEAVLEEIHSYVFNVDEHTLHEVNQYYQVVVKGHYSESYYDNLVLFITRLLVEQYDFLEAGDNEDKIIALERMAESELPDLELTLEIARSILGPGINELHVYKTQRALHEIKRDWLRFYSTAPEVSKEVLADRKQLLDDLDELFNQLSQSSLEQLRAW